MVSPWPPVWQGLVGTQSPGCPSVSLCILLLKATSMLSTLHPYRPPPAVEMTRDKILGKRFPAVEFAVVGM